MPPASSQVEHAAHWTCCTPRPEPVERISFIDRGEWDGLITRGEQLLKTNQVSFTQSLRGQVIKDSLSDLLDARLPSARRVQMLPLACERRSKTWCSGRGGLDPRPLAEPGNIPASRFELLPENICRELLVENGRVVGAKLEHLPSAGGPARRYRNRRGEFALYPAAALEIQHSTESIGTLSQRPPHAVLPGRAQARAPGEDRQSLDAPPPSIDPVPIPKNDPIPNVWIPFSYPEHPSIAKFTGTHFHTASSPATPELIIEPSWICAGSREKIFVSATT